MAKRKDKLWQYLYVTSFFAILLTPVGFIAFNELYSPEVKSALFNRNNGLYQNEDLTKTDSHEGEVKQYIVDVMEDTFDFSYLDFVTDSDYQKLINGEKDQDIPDLRDFIRPHYSSKAHKKVVRLLSDAPWVSMLYRDRGYIKPVTSQPPIRRNSNSWSTNSQGRLYGIYDGSVVARLMLPDRSDSRRYRVDYTVTITRKPLLFENSRKQYFFQPLVKRNVGEWFLTDVEWSISRVM
tara:strand:- start:92286 stop:92996 length:711 start_codon:yes stop_codon:yes gene_type:complete